MNPNENNLDYDKFLACVHPEDRELVNKSIKQIFKTKTFVPFTHRIVLKDGTVKTMQAKGEVMIDKEGNVIKMIGTGQDITEQQKAQQQLLEKTLELETTNIELQKFAYVASHDLQEPLRKILTFASLLDKEAKDALNDKSRMYIDKIVHS